MSDLKIGKMSDRAIAIHGIKMSGEQRANLEKKSECPGLVTLPTNTVPVP